MTTPSIQFMRVHVGDCHFRVVSYRIVHQIRVHTIIKKSAAFKTIGNDSTVFVQLRVNTNEFQSELLQVDLTDIAPNKRHAAIVSHARALALSAWENKGGMRMGDMW